MQHKCRLGNAGLVWAGLMLVVAGCGEGSGPSGSDPMVDLYVGVAGDAGAGAVEGAAGPLAAETVELGGNTLVIEEVQLVLRKIALQRQLGTDDCSDDESEESAESEADDATDDGASCSLLRLGPVLVDVPLDGAPTRLFSIDAEPGTFRRLMFQLHKPSNAGSDAAFIAANPQFDGVSVRVAGTFDGEPFEYFTDLTATQHSALDPPLEVTVAGPTDLTLDVDLSGWFLNQAGTGLINPADAGSSGQLDARVRQNIRNSFRGRRGHDPD